MKRSDKKADNSNCSSFKLSELLEPQQPNPEYGRYAYNFCDLPLTDPTPVATERRALIGQVGTSGGGEALDSKTRVRMENDFGYNFGAVKIHTDNYATNLTKALSANATCYGQDIYFGKNQYNPNTQKGTNILKHELTHYQQQAQTGLKLIQNNLPISGETGSEQSISGYTCSSGVVNTVFEELKSSHPNIDLLKDILISCVGALNIINEFLDELGKMEDINGVNAVQVLFKKVINVPYSPEDDVTFMKLRRNIRYSNHKRFIDLTTEEKQLETDVDKITQEVEVNFTNSIGTGVINESVIDILHRWGDKVNLLLEEIEATNGTPVLYGLFNNVINIEASITTNVVLRQVRKAIVKSDKYKGYVNPSEFENRLQNNVNTIATQLNNSVTVMGTLKSWTDNADVDSLLEEIEATNGTPIIQELFKVIETTDPNVPDNRVVVEFIIDHSSKYAPFITNTTLGNYFPYPTNNVWSTSFYDFDSERTIFVQESTEFDANRRYFIGGQLVRIPVIMEDGLKYRAFVKSSDNPDSLTQSGLTSALNKRITIIVGMNREEDIREEERKGATRPYLSEFRSRLFDGTLMAKIAFIKKANPNAVSTYVDPENGGSGRYTRDDKQVHVNRVVDSPVNPANNAPAPSAYGTAGRVVHERGHEVMDTTAADKLYNFPERLWAATFGSLFYTKNERGTALEQSLENHNFRQNDIIQGNITFMGELRVDFQKVLRDNLSQPSLSQAEINIDFVKNGVNWSDNRLYTEYDRVYTLISNGLNSRDHALVSDIYSGISLVRGITNPRSISRYRQIMGTGLGHISHTPDFFETHIDGLLNEALANFFGAQFDKDQGVRAQKAQLELHFPRAAAVFNKHLKKIAQQEDPEIKKRVPREWTVSEFTPLGR